MPYQHEYYTLISSLPLLRYTEEVERLPINEVRLQERLNMLEPDDRELVARMQEVIIWQEHPVERTDAEVVSSFRKITAQLAAARPVIMQIIEHRMHVRTVMAALRRKHQGLPAPDGREVWGVEPWTHHIVRNWDAPDFKLKAVFPWISQARQYLENGESLNLERMIMKLTWDRVNHLTQDNMFGFEVVLAYMLKWDVLQRWLISDHEQAQARFDTLVTEVIGEHDRLFD